MKKLLLPAFLAALSLLISCSKQETEAEKNVEVERQVQARLAAEHQTEEQQKLSQQQADLDARERALAEKEKAVTPMPFAEPPSTPVQRTLFSAVSQPVLSALALFVHPLAFALFALAAASGHDLAEPNPSLIDLSF